MLLRRFMHLLKSPLAISRGEMSSTHVERTADSSRSEVFSWVTVKGICQLSPTVKGFSLDVADREVSCLAGQWVDLHIPALGVIGGYSIVTPPHHLSEKRSLDLAIKYDQHPPTHWMSTKCQVGDKLKIRVGGDFYYSPAENELKDVLLIGGGVGINPLFSMLLHHMRLLSASSGKWGRVHLLYSSKTEGELLFKDRISAIALGCDKVKVQYFVTATDSTPDPTVKCGRISSADITSSLSDLDTANLSCYLCGPPPMTETMMNVLIRNCGLDQSQIHYEKWW